MASMARTRVTLRDVARRAGVHPSTVSRVLNPATRAMVSAEVAERVRKIADEMGYHANPFAYSLKTNRSSTIGVMVPDIASPVFPPIIRAVQRTLGEAGYTAILADSDNRPEQEQVVLDKMKARQVDGLILATAHRSDGLIEQCIAEGIPIVLVNRTTGGDGALSVTSDDAAGIRLAVDHLVDLGHRSIAHIAGPQSLSTGFGRHQGFVRACRGRGLTPDEGLVYFCDGYGEEEGRAALATLIGRGRAFTAVVAGNDLLALGCYDALEERGMVCPRDLSVTGFNDMPFADKFKPPLTTIRVGLDEMGTHAARLLLGLLGDRRSDVHSIRLAPCFVLRGSTCRPAGIFG